MATCAPFAYLHPKGIVNAVAIGCSFAASLAARDCCADAVLMLCCAVLAILPADQVRFETGAPMLRLPCCAAGRYGNFYAVEVERTLGLEEAGGMLRVGFMHYSTKEEVDRTLEAIEAA